MVWACRIREQKHSDPTQHMEETVFRHKPDQNPHQSLQAVPGLSHEDVELVWAQGSVVHVPAGWSMVHEAEPPDTAYLILEGQTRITLHNKTVTHLGPGDFVGEIAPIAHRLRTATVTAVEPLLTLAFPTKVFTQLREQVPSFDEAVTRIATERIKEIDGNA